MTQSQLLHALYVSDGTLVDTENYIKTGKLANGMNFGCVPRVCVCLLGERRWFKLEIFILFFCKYLDES